MMYCMRCAGKVKLTRMFAIEHSHYITARHVVIVWYFFGVDFIVMFQSMPGSPDTRHIVLYVLFGVAGLLAFIFIAIFFQYCRVYRMAKEEELDGLVSSAVTPAEYEVEFAVIA